jgi:hypothetical protein
MRKLKAWLYVTLDGVVQGPENWDQATGCLTTRRIELFSSSSDVMRTPTALSRSPTNRPSADPSAAMFGAL